MRPFYSKRGSLKKVRGRPLARLSTAPSLSPSPLSPARPEPISLTVRVDPGRGPSRYSSAGDEAVHVGAPGPYIQQLERDPVGSAERLAAPQSSMEDGTLQQRAVAAAVEPY